MPKSEYRDLLETFIIYSQKDLSAYNDPNTPNPRHPLLLKDLKKHTQIGDGLPEYPKITKKSKHGFPSLQIPYYDESTQTIMEKTKNT